MHYLFVDAKIENGRGDRPRANDSTRRIARSVVMHNYKFKQIQEVISTGATIDGQIVFACPPASTPTTVEAPPPSIRSTSKPSNRRRAGTSKPSEKTWRRTVLDPSPDPPASSDNMQLVNAVAERSQQGDLGSADSSPQMLPHWHCDSTAVLPWIPTTEALRRLDPQAAPLIAMCFGHAQDNANMISAGRKLFATAISLLRQEVSHVTTTAEVNRNAYPMVAKILTLAICESFQPISTDPLTWTKHVCGMLALLRSSRRPVCSEERSLVWRVRHMCFMTSLSRRRGVDLRTFDRLLLDPNTATSLPAGSTEQLFQLGLLVPRLLERTDAITSAPDFDLSTITLLRDELVHLERTLSGWSSAFWASHHQMLCKKHCPIPSDAITRDDTPESTFKTFLSHTPASGMCLTGYTLARTLVIHAVCLLFVRQAILELGASDAAEPHEALAAPVRALVASLFEALGLFVNSSDRFVRVYSALGLIHFLETHLQRAGDAESLRECRAYKHNLQEQNADMVWEACLPWTFMSPAMYMLEVESHPDFAAAPSQSPMEVGGDAKGEVKAAD